MFSKIFLGLIIFGNLLFSSAGNSLNLELTQGMNVALPIGVESFGQTETGKLITEIIRNDFGFSGQFKVVPEIQNGYAGQEALLLWRQAGADSVIQGKLQSLGGDRWHVEYQLLDVASRGRVLLSQDYQIASSDARSIAHHISDEVYRKLTGERGIFSTKIAYIIVKRNADKPQYNLEVADVDGYHPQRLLTSSEPIMSPTWSPDGKKIAYVSFEKKRAQIYTVNVETGQRRLLTDFPGINGAPAWSPDGRHMAMVLSKSGSAKIYSVDLSNGAIQQLTFGTAIDTEPRYSPDGQSLLFTSGRGGSPQIYRLNLANGQISRVSFAGNYNARATYTPNQQNVVMLHREDRNFNIGVQSNSGAITTLTHSFMDESPSVSPNGKLILYATQQNNRGILAMVSIDGRIQLRLPSRDGDVQEPAWSPYLG